MSPRMLILTFVMALNIIPNKAQKPILRVGLGDENEQKTISDVDKFVDERDIGRYTQRYKQGFENELWSVNKDRYDGKYTQRDIFEDRDDSTMEDGHIIGTQNKGEHNILALILLGKSTEHYSSEESQSYSSSLESANNQNTHLLQDLKQYLRSGVWKCCGKKAAKVCTKACKEAIKRGCSGSCKSRVKERMRKDCKDACRDRFDVTSSDFDSE